MHPILVSLLVLQALEYLDLFLHLCYEVASLLLYINLVDLRVLQITEQAFLLGLEGSPFAIALGLDLLNQQACFLQLPLGVLELRVFLSQLQGLPPRLEDLHLKLTLNPN